ncbi:glycosyl hydrolase [Enterococcus faecalis]|uniref:glycoside hydrolase family 31 protein n=1 Tax=Enterococcus faecalis TaxID=1351 RepID=UPI000CF14828|nr:TIM-barrel domain-containing protein [Enterococcus faecalis]PQD14586.1 glycosyl hydrolase [Enterococcus faecalis]
MKLAQEFSEILSFYNNYINSRRDNEQKLKLTTTSLPITAAAIWVKVRTGIILNEEDYTMIYRIQKEWSNKTKNVFEEPADIYTSNLAIYYMTLLEVKNNYSFFELQKEITEIRDYIFAHMIRKGALISSIEKGEPDFDIVLSVLPFGLFAPEDLVMVAGIQQLTKKKKLVSKNEAALLGIYYTEKYDFTKADNYLAQTKIAVDDGNILTCLFETYLKEKKASISTNDFIHKPLGNGNIYDNLPYERSPHYPIVGEDCTFKVQVNSKYVKEVVLILDGLGEVICELVDEQQNIYQGTVNIPVGYTGGTYSFLAVGDTKERSETYQLTIQKVSTGAKPMFLGSCVEGNIYQLESNGPPLFLMFQQAKVQLVLAQPQPCSKEVNKRYMYLNEQQQIMTPTGEPLLQFHENMLQLHELMGQGISGISMNFNDQSEIYYGFGERYNAINQLGNQLDCFVYNQYRDQGTRTYLPMPYFFTDRGYGMYIDTDYYTSFDLQKAQSGVVTVFIETEPTDFFVEIKLLHGSMKEMIGQYITCTGEPIMVPSWALGPWMSSNNWDRDSIVRQQVELTNQYDIPSTVIVLEQWSDETTYYMFNDAQYPMLKPGESHSYHQMTFPKWGRWPDPQGLIDYCHENGLKFILWQIPIEKYLNQQKHPLKDQDEAYMIEKGFVVKNADGSPYRIPENWFTDSLLMDFTNDEAKKWWFEKRQYLIEIGVDGFKTDGGEMVYGADVTFSDGSTGRNMRNNYPKEYIKAYYEFAQQNKGITFSRSGYTGAQTYPAHWAGDERSTFESFKRQLIAGINSGMSGVLFWGWDLGGFNGDIPSAELFMRATSMATFCPIMQYHAESKGEFNQDRTPWNIAERTNTPKVIDVYRFFANTRMNLLPYIYDQAMNSVNQQKPLMNALQIEYPKEDFQNCYDQFMFGESLLVAPVIEEKAIARNVQFPEGRWTDFWTHKIYDGGTTVEVSAEVHQIPVFIKENSAVFLNLGNTGVLGETIGNDLTQYTKPKLIITVKTDFEQTIVDYLGNTIHIKVTKDDRSVSCEQQLAFDIEWIEL